MNGKLIGKIALVTGGGSGIGKAIVNALRNEGCKVYYTSRTACPENKSCWLLDMEDSASLSGFIKQIQGMDKIDIFINNAGINLPEAIDQIEDKHFLSTLHVNLICPSLFLKEVSKKMKHQGQGKIVNIASIAGIVTKKNSVAYTSSKSGLLGLTRAAAIDLAPFGVLVNTVSPGPTETKMVERLISPEEKNRISKAIPLARLAKPEEVANAVLFLCSELNTYITGQNIVVDGGYTIT
jgi:3-oxoacyl-[acyl-carrier protein] reductase